MITSRQPSGPDYQVQQAGAAIAEEICDLGSVISKDDLTVTEALIEISKGIYAGLTTSEHDGATVADALFSVASALDNVARAIRGEDE